MSGDDYCLPTFDVIEESGKVSLGLRGPEFRAWPKPPIGLVDWTGRLIGRRRKTIKGAGFQAVRPPRDGRGMRPRAPTGLFGFSRDLEEVISGPRDNGPRSAFTTHTRYPALQEEARHW